MTDRPIPPEVLREFAAAVALVRHSPPSSVQFRVSCDKHGAVRVSDFRLEGTASELAAALSSKP